MKVFRDLRAKLIYIAVFAVAVAALPCYSVYTADSRRLEKVSLQMTAVRLLDCVAKFSNGAYAKDNSLPRASKAEMQDAAAELVAYYESISATNMRVKSLFSKGVFAAFQKKKMRAGAVSDMAGVITDRASLFSDSRTGIRILMETSGMFIPSIMTDLFLLRQGLSGKDAKVSNAVSIFQRVSVQTRSMLYRLGQSPTGDSYKINSEIFERTNRINSQLARTEKSLAQLGQSVEGRAAVVEAVDMLETQIFELWILSNKNLGEMLSAKLAEQREKIVWFWGEFAAVATFAFLAVLLLARSVLSGVSKLASAINSAAMGDINSAREACETSAAKFAEYGEVGECFSALLNYVADLMEKSKNIANVSNRINLMLSSMSATKTALLVSVKDSFAEADKQIKTDYDFVMQESTKLGDCLGQIVRIERDLKTSRKCSTSLRENVASVAALSASVAENFSQCSGMLERLASLSSSLNDAAKRINLLGLDLSVIARRLGAESEGADTLATQIRQVSRGVGVLVASVESLRDEMVAAVSSAGLDNSKIRELAELSKNASSEADELSSRSFGAVSLVSGQISTIASSLKSNISSGFAYDSSVQDLDDIKDSIRDISAIVRKSADAVDSLRAQIRGVK